jgi:hypothetical protein
MTLEPGQLCRYRRRDDLTYHSLGDVVVRVVRQHPKLPESYEIEALDGWKTWVRRSDLYPIKEQR